jgi:surface antigen
MKFPDLQMPVFRINLSRHLRLRLYVLLGVVAAAASYACGGWFAGATYSDAAIASAGPYHPPMDAPSTELSFSPPVVPAPARVVTAVAAPVPAPAVLAVARPASYINNYTPGNCTWYVATRRSIPGNWGNAVNWYWAAQASGYKVGTAPVAGAIAWTGANGINGSGHVAYVEAVSGDRIYISEMNYNGNFNAVTRRWAPASSFKYIY